VIPYKKPERIVRAGKIFFYRFSPCTVSGVRFKPEQQKRGQPVKVNPCFHRPINCRILCRVNAAAYNATMQTHKKTYTENSQKKMVLICMGYPLTLLRAVPWATMAIDFPVLVDPVQSLH
jgi:hypothetical protein